MWRARATPRFCTASALALTAPPASPPCCAGAFASGLASRSAAARRNSPAALSPLPRACRRCRRLAVLAGFDLRHAGLRHRRAAPALGRGVGRLVALLAWRRLWRLGVGRSAPGRRPATPRARPPPACRLRRWRRAAVASGGAAAARPRRPWPAAVDELASSAASDRRPLSVCRRQHRLSGVAVLGRAVGVLCVPCRRSRASVASLALLASAPLTSLPWRGLAVLGVGVVLRRLSWTGLASVAGFGRSARSAPFRALGSRLPGCRRLGRRGCAVEQIGERAWPAPWHPAPEGCGRWAAWGRDGRTAWASDATLGTEDLTLRNGNCSFVCNRRATRGQKLSIYINGLMETGTAAAGRRPARIAGSETAPGTAAAAGALHCAGHGRPL